MTADNFIRLTTSAIGLKVAIKKQDLMKLYNVTLYQIQNYEKENSLTVEQIVEQSLQKLKSLNAIKESLENGEYSLTHLASAAMTGLYLLLF